LAHKEKKTGTFLKFSPCVEKKSMELAITTVTHNNRASLRRVVADMVSQTLFGPDSKWFFVMQNCTQEFEDDIAALCAYHIDVEVIRFQDNIGLSKSMAYVIERTKDYEFTLNLEDDWRLLHSHVAENKQWLNNCLSFMHATKQVSTVFLRAYNNEQEKWQYGWTRCIPYPCHEFDDNFNFQDKIQKADVKLTHNTLVFSWIPSFLFTFNPCLVRNADYHLQVYPLPINSADSKKQGENSQWGCCEAIAMERTRHLTSFWLGEGVFGHEEDWFTASGEVATHNC
jgi:hypothetical protein